MCYFKSTILCSAPTAIVLSGWKMQKRLFRTSCYGFGKTAKDPLSNIRSSMLQEVDIYQINELSKHIQRAINELPPTYREAFIMHRFQNLSYKEAAELLNVSPKTVDYRIQQALKILRVKLKDYLPLILMHLLTSH